MANDVTDRWWSIKEAQAARADVSTHHHSQSTSTGQRVVQGDQPGHPKLQCSAYWHQRSASRIRRQDHRGSDAAQVVPVGMAYDSWQVSRQAVREEGDENAIDAGMNAPIRKNTSRAVQSLRTCVFPGPSTPLVIPCSDDYPTLCDATGHQLQVGGNDQLHLRTLWRDRDRRIGEHCWVRTQ